MLSSLLPPLLPLLLSSSLSLSLCNAVSASVLTPAPALRPCPSSYDTLTSCSPAATSPQNGDLEGEGIDPCCTPTPGGTFLFRQRYEPFGGDEGRWGIDGLDVLDCDLNLLRASRHGSGGGGGGGGIGDEGRMYTHEQIGSFFAKSEEYTTTLGEGYQDIWEHEWSTSEVGEGVEEVMERVWRSSGPEISTLEPGCFDDYRTGVEVPEFFDAIRRLHERIPTKNWLEDANIDPSDEITYSRKEIVDALRGTGSGMHPLVTCVNDTLSTVSWPMHVNGRFQDARFVPADVDLNKVAGQIAGSRREDKECPLDGIRYPPSDFRPEPTPRWDDNSLHPNMRPLKNYLSANGLHATGRSQNVDDQSVFVAGNKAVVDKKLGFFKDKDEWRDEDKDAEKGDTWRENSGRRTRDEL